MHIAMARRALVQVHAGPHGKGAGIILHKDGLILTNAHVTRRRTARITMADGADFAATLLAYDERMDLAAYSVDAAELAGKELTALPIGDSRLLKPGSLVIAVGHPWGVLGAATAGMVIGLGHSPEMATYPGPLIQAGLHLRPGHSGGPMLNTDGALVGVNTMIAGPLVGLAIPSYEVSRFLKGNLGKAQRQRRPPQRVRV